MKIKLSKELIDKVTSIENEKVISAFDKLSKDYFEGGSRKKFVQHLFYSFLPPEKGRSDLVDSSDTPSKLVCCITGNKLMSRLGLELLEGKIKSLSDPRTPEYKKAGKNLEEKLQRYRTIQSDRSLAFKSNYSDKVLSSEAVIALTKLYVKLVDEGLEGKSVKPGPKRLHTNRRSTVTTLGDLPEFEKLKNLKFN